METMNCSEAMRLARDEGARITRVAWEDKEHGTTQWVGTVPSEAFGLTCDVFSISGTGSHGEQRCPVFYSAWSGIQNGMQRGYTTLGWQPSQDDILATDWYVIDTNGVKRRGVEK